jgi:hypothetical protein
MLHALISLFGFAKVAPKPRRPTARARMPSASEQAAARRQREADRQRAVDDEAIRAARAVSTIGGAADVYARHVGQVGSKPSAAYFSRAKDVLGPRRRAFFEALVLAGRPIPMIPVDKIGDEGRETGFADGIDRDLNANLDLWASVRGLERTAADQARRLGRPIPDPIVIPADIEQRLLERDRLRAARAGAGGQGRRAPAAPAAAAVEADVPTTEPEQGGGRGRVARAAKDDEEDSEMPRTPPEEAAKPASDDDGDPSGPGGP